jgi:hypothetical protein
MRSEREKSVGPPPPPPTLCQPFPSLVSANDRSVIKTKVKGRNEVNAAKTNFSERTLPFVKRGTVLIIAFFISASPLLFSSLDTHVRLQQTHGDPSGLLSHWLD